MSLVRRFWQEILETLYPPRCAGCALVGYDSWCEDCLQSIPYLPLPVCLRCGTPISSEGFCTSCLQHPPVPEAVRAVVRYEGVVRRAIHRYKYRGYAALAPALAQLLVHGWDTPLTLPLQGAEIVVPVPIHPRRRRERGFNQSELLAKWFCQAVGLPYSSQSLRRVQYQQPQVGLKQDERRQNIQGAFRVDLGEAVAGKRVLLIDDVWTTGSTLNEAARALLASGAETVFAYVVAHEPLE